MKFSSTSFNILILLSNNHLTVDSSSHNTKTKHHQTQSLFKSPSCNSHNSSCSPSPPSASPLPPSTPKHELSSNLSSWLRMLSPRLFPEMSIVIPSVKRSFAIPLRIAQLV